MTQNLSFIDKLLSSSGDDIDKKYEKLGLRFNPFPRSGTTNINGSDSLNQKLLPVDENVKGQIIDFISNALANNNLNNEDKFISATVLGNYGSGKTQLLMFVKYLLGEIGARHKNKKNPYVMYIDNPGMKLSDFIGSIISKIGEDYFKKFIWSMIIERIKMNKNQRNRLEKFEFKGPSLFTDFSTDPYSERNSVSYKNFLNAFTRYLSNAKARKEFDDEFRKVLIEILEMEIQDSLVASYFYDLISDDYGVNKTWEALSNGNIKQLEKKEAFIIKYIVKIIKEQGYTDFFILVDEFEDITEGRLSKNQVDNYIYNLRTLLDEHREWSLLFAMNGQALRKLKSVSPPLADRITNRIIVLQDLNVEQAILIAKNYLSIARIEDSDPLLPFDEKAIRKLNDLCEGNTRKFLKNCFFIVEKASNEPKDTSIIDCEFVTKHIAKEIA